MLDQHSSSCQDSACVAKFWSKNYIQSSKIAHRTTDHTNCHHNADASKSISKAMASIIGGREIAQLNTDRNLLRSCELVKIMRLIDYCIMFDEEKPRSEFRQHTGVCTAFTANSSALGDQGPDKDLAYLALHVLNRTVFC